MRLKITFAYHGGYFHGSAPQPNGKSVLDVLQKVFASVGITERIVGSSRTDKGVHALRQVAHVDVPDFWHKRLDHLRFTTNQKLTHIHILDLTRVHDAFHSRFDATYRHYRYIIATKRQALHDALISPDRVGDFKSIKTHIKIFEGRHDFGGFKNQGTPTHTDTRLMLKCEAYAYGGYFVLSFKAKGFLRSQVRLMSGALIALSHQELSLDQLHDQLHNQTRHHKKPAPPQGLYLVRVGYF